MYGLFGVSGWERKAAGLIEVVDLLYKGLSTEVSDRWVLLSEEVIISIVLIFVLNVLLWWGWNYTGRQNKKKTSFVNEKRNT